MKFLGFLYSDVLTRIFTFYARRRLVWPVIAILPLYVRKIQKAAHTKNTINFLVIPKEGLNEDVISSLSDDKQINIYNLYRKVIKKLAVGILHHSIDDNNYISNIDEVNTSKAEYSDYLGKMWDKARKLIKIDAVIVGNFAYYAERELGTALEKRGIPFVAIHKENLKTPGRFDFFYRVYKERRGPFTGRKIFVYNNIERQLQVSTGVITEDRVVVTGMPRMDRAHRYRVSGNHGPDSSAPGPQVLFFSFRKRIGLPLLARKEHTGSRSGHEPVGGGVDELNWNNLFLGCHEAVIRLARENPQIQVVVKAKDSVRESRALSEIVFSRSGLPPNLKVEVGGDPLNLISQSNVICGFNTTALLESIAMGKPVIVPWFEEAALKKMRPYIIDLEDAVLYARSPDELIDLLTRHAMDAGPPSAELGSNQKRVLDKWVGNTDGRSGERVRNELLATVFPTPAGSGQVS